ncbi:MAG TPA: ABC-2 family transporter protein [Pirellulales bacterium]
MAGDRSAQAADGLSIYLRAARRTVGELGVYLNVFLTFARNSLVRDMTFRMNFLIESLSSLTWMLMNLGFYLLVYQHTSDVAGWDKYQFFAFMATTMIVNALVQTFFMPNVDEFAESIRTGGLDFALLKPIDTQFLISLAKVEWASLSNFVFGVGLLIYSLTQLKEVPSWPQLALYPVFILCGVMILYSLLAAMAAASIWLGRNTSLYDFWFYITIFSRYPREIYRGPWGEILNWFFTFLVPILIVVNVPAQTVVHEFDRNGWLLALYGVVAAIVSFVASRLLFRWALVSYRSASS